MPPDLFAGLRVHDRDAAVAWYSRLLGSGPVMFPNEVEAVWEIADARHVYVEADPARAGGGLVTVFVDDLVARVDGAAARGVTPVLDETYGNGVRKVTYRDPDGNEFGLAGPATAPGSP